MYQLQVENMSCGHCVGAVTRAVREVDANAPRVCWTRHSDPRQFLAAEPTTTVSSPDAALVPHAFRALTRT